MGVEMQIASVGLSLLGAQAQRKAYQAEAAAYNEQADMAGIQSDQQEISRREQLRRQLASLGTSMSAQGVALGTSPSVEALERGEVKIASSDISSIRLMGLSNRRKYGLSAAGSMASAKAATIGSMANAGSSIYKISTGKGVV